MALSIEEFLEKWFPHYFKEPKNTDAFTPRMVKADLEEMMKRSAMDGLKAVSDAIESIRAKEDGRDEG